VTTLAGADAPTERAARRIAMEAAMIAVLVFICYAFTHPDPVRSLGRLYDDAVYLSVGKSIAEGTGYRSVHLVGSPVHVKFPPLLPTLTALSWQAFGDLARVARTAMWMNIVIVSVSAGVLWWLARVELKVGAVPAALFAIVPLLTDRTMFYVSGVMSEPWMLLASLVSLVLVRRVAREHRAGRRALGTAVALGLTLAVALFARTQSAAVVVGVLVGAALMRVGWRNLGVATAALTVPVLAWRAWHGALIARGPVSPLPDQSSYATWFPSGAGELAVFAGKVVRASVPLYWSNTAELLVGWSSPKTLALATVILACGAIGVVLLMRRFAALSASVICSVGLLVMWPYVQDRFLTPLLPVIGLAGAFAVQQVLDRGPRVMRVPALLAMTGMSLMVLVVNLRSRIEARDGQTTAPFSAALAGMVEWIDRNTTPDEHVMAPWGAVIYLHTGRRTSIPNPEEAMFAPSVFDRPRSFLATRLLADSVDIVAIWDGAPGRAAPWLRTLGEECPGSFSELPQPTEVRTLHFYRVRRHGACLERLATARTD
jgi:hypothetical protein